MLPSFDLSQCHGLYVRHAGNLRYKVLRDPIIIHCCHCRLCQRQTGTGFTLNAPVEATQVQLLNGSVEVLTIASPSGKGQIIARCPECRVAVWIHYYIGGLRELICFIRVGTLDTHIFTSTQQPWLYFPTGVEPLYSYKQI